MTSMSRDDELLALWEGSLAAAQQQQPGWQRDAALLRVAGCAEPRGLGARNAELMALRTRLFGAQWPLRATCPRCATVVEFDIDDAARLANEPAPAEEDAQPLLDDGGAPLEVRAPDVDDLHAAAAAARSGSDAQAAADELLRRCVAVVGSGDDIVEPRRLSPALRARIAARMEALDPAASVAFAVDCPQCSTPWRAALDIGEVLRSEIAAHAEQVLLDVDALARAYGWSERDVLALTPARRAAYLQLAGAA